MNTNNKTLADVKPGGRVRLPQSDLNLINAAAVDAFQEAYELEWERYVEANGDSQEARMGGADRAATTAGMIAALPHLSAQPSPGGQGDACAIIEEFIQCATLGRPHGKLIAQAKDYLAARQPVGPKFYTEDGPCWWHGGKAFIVTVDGDKLQLSVMDGPRCEFIGDARPFRVPAQLVGEPVAFMVRWKAAGGFGLEWPKNMQYFRDRADEYEIVPLHREAPPAQAVGEPVAYTSEAQLNAVRVSGDGIMSQRNAKWRIPLYTAPPAQAVDLGPSIPSELAPVAAALKRFNESAEDCDSDGCDIGRDWFDALTTIGLLKRTQRSPAVWTMTAEGKRLLALIDGKAVGNG